MNTEFDNISLDGLLYVNEGMSSERQERVLSAIAQSITGNLTVRVRVCPMEYDTAYTDGNTIYTGDDASLVKKFIRRDGKKINPFLLRLKLVVHETLHALFTPYKKLEAEKVSLALEGYPPEKVSRIFNVIEDLIIESREPSVFGGWVHSAFIYGSYINYICTPKLEFVEPERQWETAVTNLRDSINLDRGVRLNGKFSSFKAMEVYTKTYPLLEKIVNFSYTSSEKFNLMKDVVKAVLDAFPAVKELSEAEMARKPMDSRVAEPPDMPSPVAFPDADGNLKKDSSGESSVSDEKDNLSTKQNNSDENPYDTGEEYSDAYSQEASDDNMPHTQESTEPDETSGSLSEAEEKIESERKITKILKQINQYAVGLEKMENNSSMSDKLLARDFGESFKHIEKHTGSLTVLPEDRAFYDAAIKGNIRLIRSLNALFKKELKRVKNEDEYFTSGRIAPLRYFTHSKRSVEIFKRPMGDSGANEAAITVRIDQSGSMSNRYSKRGKKLCNEAGELACVLTEVFCDLDVSLQVAGFAEVGDEEEHEIFKEFSSSSTPKEAVAKSRLNKSSATPTGWTIYQGVKELLRRPEQNKVFILITDGYPSSQVSKYFMSTNHIRKHIREAENKGVAFLCLLVGECEPSLHHKIFGDNLIVANKNQSLAVAISPKLKKTAKKWNA